MEPIVPRALLLRVIRRASEIAGSPPIDHDEDAEFRWAIEAACRTEDISPQAYDRGLAGDPELERLQAMAFCDAVGSPDPGPYGAISRESPSGQAGDTAKARSTG
jgi:hypothetical protein